MKKSFITSRPGLDKSVNVISRKEFVNKKKSTKTFHVDTQKNVSMRHFFVYTKTL